MLSYEDSTNWATANVHNHCNRAAEQDNMMLFQCLLNSVNKDVKKKHIPKSSGHKVNDTNISAICDVLQEGAINACEGNRSVPCRWKCYDIVCRIKHELDNSSITFLFKHADGHQVAVKPFETLTDWEQANYWADKYAKEALRD